MTNTYVNQCKKINKVAKFSDGWYDKKAQYDKNNKVFNDFLYTVYTGLIVCAIVAIALYFIGVTGKARKAIVGLGGIGLVLCIVGAIGAVVSAKDEPKPNASEFQGCV